MQRNSQQRDYVSDPLFCVLLVDVPTCDRHSLWQIDREHFASRWSTSSKCRLGECSHSAIYGRLHTNKLWRGVVFSWALRYFSTFYLDQSLYWFSYVLASMSQQLPRLIISLLVDFFCSTLLWNITESVCTSGVMQQPRLEMLIPQGVLGSRLFLFRRPFPSFAERSLQWT